MKLKDFIEELEKIKEEKGENINVIMADNTPVIFPVFLDNYPEGKNVVITDEEKL